MATSLRISAMHEVTETENTMRGFTWLTNFFARRAPIVTDTNEAPIVINTNEAVVADLERKMENALRLAFNTGKMVAEILDATAMEPVLAADGQSVVNDYDTIIVVVLPYKEELHVSIRNHPEATVYKIVDGYLSLSNQRELIGLLTLSKRDNPTLDADMPLTGVKASADQAA